jgi:peptide-methionine (S)-S-oxide reductase
VKSETIVLGTGCFWCSEAAYQLVKGVTAVVPGYAGGNIENPTYEQVLTGTTGHVEVVRVTFDPDVVSLEQLLAVFWTIHDPTSLNRQGADVGSQYASVIFYGDEAQRRVAEASRDEAQTHLSAQIVTRVEPLQAFYEAEDYHHNYFENHPEAGYCQAVISPKLSKLRDHFAELLESS